MHPVLRKREKLIQEKSAQVLANMDRGHHLGLPPPGQLLVQPNDGWDEKRRPRRSWKKHNMNQSMIHRCTRCGSRSHKETTCPNRVPTDPKTAQAAASEKDKQTIKAQSRLLYTNIDIRDKEYDSKKRARCRAPKLYPLQDISQGSTRQLDEALRQFELLDDFTGLPCPSGKRCRPVADGFPGCKRPTTSVLGPRVVDTGYANISFRTVWHLSLIHI